jgi:hypothetical protein
MLHWWAPKGLGSMATSTFRGRCGFRDAQESGPEGAEQSRQKCAHKAIERIIEGWKSVGGWSYGVSADYEPLPPTTGHRLACAAAIPPSQRWFATADSW